MTRHARSRTRTRVMPWEFWHGVQGFVAWLLAGVAMGALYSTTAGPGAWWVLAVVSPFVLVYGGMALSAIRPDRRTHNKSIGFAVYGGRMTSTGSAGAMYPGDFDPEVLAPYHSTSGIGGAHPDNEPKAERTS